MDIYSILVENTGSNLIGETETRVRNFFRDTNIPLEEEYSILHFQADNYDQSGTSYIVRVVFVTSSGTIGILKLVLFDSSTLATNEYARLEKPSTASYIRNVRAGFFSGENFFLAWTTNAWPTADGSLVS